MQHAGISIVSFLETIHLFVPNVKTKGRKKGKEGEEKRERKRKKQLGSRGSRTNRQEVDSGARVGFQTRVD